MTSDSLSLGGIAIGGRSDQLVTGVLESSIGDYVMAEENLALFTRRMINLVQPESLRLVTELEAYRDALR